jgi:hypothetical protein
MLTSRPGDEIIPSKIRIKKQSFKYIEKVPNGTSVDDNDTVSWIITIPRLLQNTMHHKQECKKDSCKKDAHATNDEEFTVYVPIRLMFACMCMLVVTGVGVGIGVAVSTSNEPISPPPPPRDTPPVPGLLFPPPAPALPSTPPHPLPSHPTCSICHPHHPLPYSHL